MRLSRVVARSLAVTRCSSAGTVVPGRGVVVDGADSVSGTVVSGALAGAGAIVDATAPRGVAPRRFVTRGLFTSDVEGGVVLDAVVRRGVVVGAARVGGGIVVVLGRAAPGPTCLAAAPAEIAVGPSSTNTTAAVAASGSRMSGRHGPERTGTHIA